MKKMKSIFALSFAFALLFSGTNAFAANEDKKEMKKIEKLSEYEMPQDVKDILLKETTSIGTMATYAVTGGSTSDTTYSATFGTNGQNTIYTLVGSPGSTPSFGYYTFSGWGYTGYFGSVIPYAGDVQASVKVKAWGFIPNISINGSNWGLMSTTKDLTPVEVNRSGYKYARANYSNTKIQSISGVNAIFINQSYIKLPSGANDSWSEDTYVWF